GKAECQVPRRYGEHIACNYQRVLQSGCDPGTSRRTHAIRDKMGLHIDDRLEIYDSYRRIVPMSNDPQNVFLVFASRTSGKATFRAQVSDKIGSSPDNVRVAVVIFHSG